MIKQILIISIIVGIIYLITSHYGWWTPIDDGGAYQEIRGWFTR